MRYDEFVSCVAIFILVIGAIDFLHTVTTYHIKDEYNCHQDNTTVLTGILTQYFLYMYLVKFVLYSFPFRLSSILLLWT